MVEGYYSSQEKMTLAIEKKKSNKPTKLENRSNKREHIKTKNFHETQPRQLTHCAYVRTLRRLSLFSANEMEKLLIFTLLQNYFY